MSFSGIEWKPRIVSPDVLYPVFYYPDRPGPKELTRRNFPPIANLILDHFPVTQFEFKDIVSAARPFYWSHAMVLSSRLEENGGDATGMVLKAVGLYDKPADVRGYINGICRNHFNQLDGSMQEEVTSLLQEKEPYHLLNSTLALNELVVRVNKDLDANMTGEGKRVRTANVTEFMDQNYTPQTVADILHYARSAQGRWFLVPHYYFSPYQTNGEGLITSVYQEVTMFRMPKENRRLLHRLTPVEYTNTGGQENPDSEDFLARNLFRFGNPFAVAASNHALKNHRGVDLLTDRTDHIRLKHEVIDGRGLH